MILHHSKQNDGTARSFTDACRIWGGTFKELDTRGDWKKRNGSNNLKWTG